MQKIITGLLIVVGIIHLLPVSGVLGAESLFRLYGLTFEDQNTLILMRHRAILFGVFGAFFIYSAFKPVYQPLAFIAGLISVVSFLILSWLTGFYNDALYKVILADVVALFCLVIATVLYVFSIYKESYLAN